jgi:signal transduction histidine kinase
MVVWTAVVTVLLADPVRRTAGLLTLDLTVAVVLLLAGLLVQRRTGAGDPRLGIDGGLPTLTLSWGAVPVVAWAVRSGPVAGGLAALAVSAATVLWRAELTRPTVGSCVLLLLTGVVVGYVVALARQAETAYAEVVQREAAQAERERLSREVHDGVLQALALVARTSPDPQLADLARGQESALRRLVAGPPVAVDGDLDLRTLLPTGADVQVALPAGPVLLPARGARELAAAVQACVDNVRRHAGGTAWLLVEDEAGTVTVSVRDDGPGIAPGRLEQAQREGRLGVARSVRGRVEDLGGSVEVVSVPGQGTEVELRVPRT